MFEENGTAYYVMDFIDGESLNDIVNREGAIPEERAVRYMRQVCDAMRYVHSNNRLHLDIKPANIMINKKDQAILLISELLNNMMRRPGRIHQRLWVKRPDMPRLSRWVTM